VALPVRAASDRSAEEAAEVACRADPPVPPVPLFSPASAGPAASAARQQAVASAAACCLAVGSGCGSGGRRNRR